MLLGYELPGAVTPWRLLTVWRFDTFLGVADLAQPPIISTPYGGCASWGDGWPVGRTVSWLAGCAALLLATGSGVRSMDRPCSACTWWTHDAEHVRPGATRCSAHRSPGAAGAAERRRRAPPGPREWIVRCAFTVHGVPVESGSPRSCCSSARCVLHPLFDTFVRYHWGHEFMALHFLITGYLFYWGIIGVDPGPRRLPFLGRLALLFAIMPFHAFFGIAMMTMESTVGGTSTAAWPALGVGHQRRSTPRRRDRLGLERAPLLMVVIALVAQWARRDAVPRSLGPARGRRL